jgi:TldD protein
VEPGRYDVVLDGRALSGLLAATIGRALQMDRVFGQDMSTTGTSYLNPPEKTLGKFSYGNPLLTVRGSRSIPGALGTVKWDDEGVPPDDFTLIKNGLVVDYMTTREFASKLEGWYKERNMPVRSHGCAAAGGPAQAQVVADPTLIMDADVKETSVEELISGVKRGIYFSDRINPMVDPALRNVETLTYVPVYEIRNGKLGGMVQQASIVGRTTDIWKAMDAIGGKATLSRQEHVVTKGEPAFQLERESICPAARFRQMSVSGFGRKG